MFQTSQHTSGLRLLTIPVASVPSVSVLVLIKVGSRYENEKTNGLAHFVEHMVFQGNDKWPNKLALSTAVERVGAEYNGLTGKEYTGYFVKAQKSHLDLALEVLSQMLWHSKFEKTQIEREKPVIVEEINYRQDQPQVAVGDMIMEAVFSGHPLGLSGAGEKEAVQKFKRDDFLSFHQDYYYSKNTIIVIAGDFDQKKASDLIEKYFNRVPKGLGIASLKWSNKTNKSKKIHIKTKNTDQTHFCLGTLAFKRTAKERYAQALLNIVLGSGVSSRLFQKIREEKSLAYYIDSDVDTYEDTGIFTVSAGVNPTKLTEALSTVTGELDKITKSSTISDKELNKAKDYLAGKLVLQLEESLNQAMFYGLEWLLEDKIPSVEEILTEVRKVTREEVVEVARKIFKPENYKLAVVGNKVEKEKIEQLFK